MNKTITTTPTHTTVAIEFESDDDVKAFDAYAKSLWRAAQRAQQRQQRQQQKTSEKNP